MCRNPLSFVWPTSDRCVNPSYEDDLAAIENARWVEKPEVFLEEARRLRDTETARKNTADTKSQIYLAALLAMFPLVINIFGLDFIKNALAGLELYSVIALGLMGVGVSYAIAAFFYAFSTLKVGKYNCIYVDDFVKYASSNTPEEELTRQILLSVRRDQMAINNKVGLVKLTQRHIARMAVMFICGVSLLGLAPLFCSA